jgi:hypothetical protein
MKTKRPILLTLLLFLTAVLLGCAQVAPSPTPTTSAARGQVVFAIADAAVDVGAVTKINLTVDAIRIHAQGGD